MDANSIRGDLRKFIDENFVRDRANYDYSDNDSFFEKEIIDSTGVLELVLFLEETFKFRVEDDEIIPENLDSVTNLVAFISKKTTG